MSKDDDDMSSEGRIHDGYQFCVRLVDGSREWPRDHDRLDAVTARIDAVAGGVSDPTSLALARVQFSGARSVEEDDAGVDVIGPVRGKGWIYLTKIAGIAYSAAEGAQPPEEAFEAARAYFAIQAQALQSFQQEAAQVAGQPPAEQGQEDGGAESVEDRARAAL
jgi:hypothetical protein